MSFEQTLDKASDTLYRFMLTDLPVIVNREQSRSLLLNCNTVFLPGISLSVERVNFLGGFINTASNDLKFDDINLIFLIDEDLNNWKTLFNWMLFMHNNKDKFGVSWDEPVVTGILTYYNNWMSKQVLEIEFQKLWPISLGQITLSTKTDGAQYLEAQSTFTFDRAILKQDF